MTLRTRLLGAVTALTLITLGGAFVAVYVVFARSNALHLDRVVLETAHADARMVGLVEKLAAAPPPTSNHGVELPRYEAIYRDGQVVAATPEFLGGVPDRRALPKTGGCFDLPASTRLRATVVPVPGQAGAELLVAVPRADLDNDMALLRQTMLVVFVASVGWGILLAAFIVVRLTRGHGRIAATARRVAAGDLGARVGTLPGNAEIAQLGRDVDDMIDRLAVLVSSQRQFIAHASHELRSPLTTLYGELSLAVRRERNAAEYRQSIEEALASTRRLKALADDLLALARMDAAVPVATGSHALPDVLAEARAAVRGDAQITVLGTCRDVKGNAADLSRLLRNLLENAVRHSPAGAPIAVELADHDRHVSIAVIDRGPGVPESERERIFAPFYRTPDTRATHDGAGLGLSIARAIARAHGGDLRHEPRSPGSAFVVTLPAAEERP